jgi:hypothetical protein
LADTRAIGQTGWADALATRTDHAAGAFSAAGAAVIEVASGIDAGAGTNGLSGGTVEQAFAVEAKLTRCTFIAASTAVIEIIEQILANTRTIG